MERKRQLLPNNEKKANRKTKGSFVSDVAKDGFGEDVSSWNEEEICRSVVWHYTRLGHECFKIGIKWVRGMESKVDCARQKSCSEDLVGATLFGFKKYIFIIMLPSQICLQLHRHRLIDYWLLDFIFCVVQSWVYVEINMLIRISDIHNFITIVNM